MVGMLNLKRAVEDRLKEPYKIDLLAMGLCGPNAFFILCCNLHVAIWGSESGKVPLHSYNRKRHLTLSDFMTYYYRFVVAKK
ncbi:hypothetical protein CWC05_16375 [Pseudoalteromonas ruthenica]|uniref:Uncharacterized protein n=1 Tax=Pseudoalteromonas ruthenica TaxID=151081 RepID=A0A5S3Z0K9_9GAMM|nr:hypothetical protein CWC05_16375 [Pseudoalteromonas ruthenica]